MAVALAVIAFVVLYGSLLKDTMDASTKVEPTDVQTALIPLLSGGLGLLLALALGVEPKPRARTFRARIREILNARGLLLTAAAVYMAAGVIGAVVWNSNRDVAPDLLTAIVLTVFGYIAAALTAAGRSSPG